MRRTHGLYLVPLLLGGVTLGGVAPASAQEAHAASAADLDAVVAARAEAAEADREALRRLLERAEVRKVAAAAGIDVRRAASAVATLDQEEVARLAPRARQIENSLAGGDDKIVISTTAVIIGLLVLLIILVAD